MANATAHPDRRLISSEDVHSTEVYGAGDAAEGEIDHLLIEKISGRVVYAVMSFGGFLGLAQSLPDTLTTPPWEAIGPVSLRRNCVMLRLSAMIHGQIEIGNNERTNTTVRPLTGALSIRETCFHPHG